MAVYLDYNATAPVRPEVVTAMTAALAVSGNPSSVHRSGRQARRLVEAAREQVGALVGGDPAQVVFTSGGTEANNLALRRLGAAQGLAGRVVVSAIEHDSVRQVVADSLLAPVGPEGTVDLVALENILAGAEAESRPVGLVAVMLANNETGAIQPVAEVAALARRFGALVHCDAVQAVGKLAVDMVALGVDSLAVSAHKLGGPQGVGALVLRRGLGIEARQRGGGQESGRRAGTENVAGIAGFGVAAEIAGRDLPRAAALAGWRDDMEGRLGALVPAVRVFAAEAGRLPNTSCLVMPGVGAETQVMALDLAGVMVSAGAACSSGKVRPSHVLRAMGASEAEAGSAIRVSLGWGSVAADIDRMVEAWMKVYAGAGGKIAAAQAPAAQAPAA